MHHTLHKNSTALSAGTSHDLNALVNGVMCMTALLENTALSVEQSEILHLLKHSAEALNEVMTTVLKQSKLETNHSLIKKEAFNLNETLKTVFKTFKFSISKPHIKARLVIEKEVPAKVKGDKTALMRILTNLLNNAGKFTENGEITLKVSSKNTDNKAQIQFEISDTGCGIPQENIENIFKPFIKYHSEGFGLGLATAKELVEQQLGNIEVQSIVDKGTTFAISLPYEITAYTLNPKTHPLSINSLKGVKILIIDDDDVYARYLDIILKENNALSTCVRTENEAFYQIENEKYDLILLDMHLPTSDGYAVAYRIRNTLNINRNTPIAGMSAGEIEREKIIFSGVNDIIPKPLPIDGVVARLQKVLINEQPFLKEITPEESFDFNPALNVPHLKAIYGNDIEHAILMFETFLTETITQTKELFYFLERDEMLKLKDKAHRLQPVFSMVGLTKIENHLQVIEKHTFDYDKHQFLGILREIDTELTNLTPILEQELLRMKHDHIGALAA
jgi:DNA-binding response OmpR family regulator